MEETLKISSPSALAACLIGIQGAHAADLLVPAEHPTIRAAISASVDGDRILVGPGVYVENIDFGSKRIEIRSVYGPSMTVLDGSGSANPTVRIFGAVHTATTVLSGFTVQGGVGGGPGCSVLGTGLAIMQGSPLIDDCAFLDSPEGGYSCVSTTSGAAPTFSGCRWPACATSPIGSLCASSPTLNDCEISLLPGSGYVFQHLGGVMRMNRCRLHVDNANGFYIYWNASVIMAGCVVSFGDSASGRLAFVNTPGPVSLTVESTEFRCAATETMVQLAAGAVFNLGAGCTFVDFCCGGVGDCDSTSCRDADIYRDFNVNGADLGILLSQWGPNTPLTESDLNEDGVVNGADLGLLLSFWGPCP